jgi:hypothetical protein
MSPKTRGRPGKRRSVASDEDSQTPPQKSTFQNGYRPNKKPGSNNFRPMNRLQNKPGELSLQPVRGNNVKGPPSKMTPAQTRGFKRSNGQSEEVSIGSSKRRKIENPMTSSPGHEDSPIVLSEDDSPMKQVQAKRSGSNSLNSDNRSRKSSKTPPHHNILSSTSKQASQQKQQSFQPNNPFYGLVSAPVERRRLEDKMGPKTRRMAVKDSQSDTSGSFVTNGATATPKQAVYVEVVSDRPHVTSSKHSLDGKDSESTDPKQKRRRSSKDVSHPVPKEPSQDEVFKSMQSNDVSNNMPQEEQETSNLQMLEMTADKISTSDILNDPDEDELQIDIPAPEPVLGTKRYRPALDEDDDFGSPDELAASDGPESQSNDIPPAQVRKNGQMIVHYYTSPFGDIKTPYVMRYDSTSRKFIFNETEKAKHKTKLGHLSMDSANKVDWAPNSEYINILGSRYTNESYLFQVAIQFETSEDAKQFMSIVESNFKPGIKLIKREK